MHCRFAGGALTFRAFRRILEEKEGKGIERRHDRGQLPRGHHQEDRGIPREGHARQDNAGQPGRGRVRAEYGHHAQNARSRRAGLRACARRKGCERRIRLRRNGAQRDRHIGRCRGRGAFHRLYRRVFFARRRAHLLHICGRERRLLRGGRAPGGGLRAVPSRLSAAARNARRARRRIRHARGAPARAGAGEGG